MVERTHLAAKRSLVSRIWRDWRHVLASLAVLVLSLGYYLSGTSSDRPLAIDEIARTASIEHQGFLDEQANLLAVSVFDPANGEWRKMTKGEVVPGEEFVAGGILFKEYIYGFMSEQHGEVDVSKLDGAYCAFDPKNRRRPTGQDVVYVFGQNLPRTGFHTLSMLQPGQTFRSQGRVYKTAEARRGNALRIIETGETLATAGGDPNLKPLNLILTQQTAHRFPNSPQHRSKAKEGAADARHDE